MACTDLSAAPTLPAHPQAKPGFGKRTARLAHSDPSEGGPGSPPGLAHLPAREAYLVAYIDRLPEGAAIDVKTLAKAQPMYGQQAVRTALRELSRVGHLRRVTGVSRVSTGSASPQHVTRTYFSAVARDERWWEEFLEGRADRAGREDLVGPADPMGREGRETRLAVPPQLSGSGGGLASAPATEPATEPAVEPHATAEPPAATAEPPTAAPTPAPPAAETSSTDVLPVQRGSRPRAGAARARPPGASRPRRSEAYSEAYEALAALGHRDVRMVLSASECAELEELAGEWMARGVRGERFVCAMTLGLPPTVHSPAALLRSRLTGKLPPEPPQQPSSEQPSSERPTPDGVPEGAEARSAEPDTGWRWWLECTLCGAPGTPQTLPGGLCRACREEPEGEGDGKASVAEGPQRRTAVRGLPEDEVRRRAGELRRVIRTGKRALHGNTT